MDINTPSPKVYSATEVAAALRISKSLAYSVMKSPGFPLIHVGNRMVVAIDKFDVWLNNAITVSISN